MRIEGYGRIGKIIESQRGMKDKKVDTPFKDILKSKIGSADTLSATKAYSIGKTLPLLVGKNFLPPKEQIVSKVEELINVLERYQARLSDPLNNMKDLHPLIEKIEKGVDELTDLLDLIPPEDRLYPILSEAIIIGTTELGRYKRGEYI